MLKGPTQKQRIKEIQFQGKISSTQAQDHLTFIAIYVHIWTLLK